MVLAGTVLGSSLAFIDSSAVTLTLPVIQQQLGGDLAAAQWIMNAYNLLLGALVLAGGAAADRYGRKRVFLCGVAAFTLASLACGLAPDLKVLIVSRAIQGVGAALLTPASLALLGATFDDDKARGQAVGIWAGASGLMSAVGPVLGGWLTETVSWRAVFLINLPPAALAVALIARGACESRGARPGPVDWRGALVVTGGLALITWSLTSAAKAGFTPPVAGALALGLACMAGFLRIERHAQSPMTPLGLFRSRAFSGLNGYTLFLYTGFSGALFLLPFLLLRAHHYPPAAAGAALLPLSAGLAFLSPLAGRLAARLGARTLLVSGPLLGAAGFALLAWRAETADYWTGPFPGLAMLAVGMGLAVAPLTTAVLGAVSKEYEGSASGINNAVARVAGLLAVALIGFVLTGESAAAVLDGYRMALAVSAMLAVAAAVTALLTVGGPPPVVTPAPRKPPVRAQ